MTSLATDAIVLHAIDYLESSRILRLVTREAGVQSVLARGARTSRKRFGSALDIFAEGHAELQIKEGRELHTLNSFEVRESRPSIGQDLERFTAAAAFAEAVLRMVHDESASRVYDVVSQTLGRISRSELDDVSADTIGGLWMLASEIGVAPTLDVCASCHQIISSDHDARFSHDAGGSLCDRCGGGLHGIRRLPYSARRTISEWLTGGSVTGLDTPTLRAHQRLFREFLTRHVTDARPLKAFAIWEGGGWGQA